jgi:hypothetical protein
MQMRTLCRDGGRTYYEVLIGDERVFVGLADECRRYARLHERKAAREVREAQQLRLQAFLRLLDDSHARSA